MFISLCLFVHICLYFGTMNCFSSSESAWACDALEPVNTFKLDYLGLYARTFVPIDDKY